MTNYQRLALFTSRPGARVRRSGQYVPADRTGKPIEGGGEITCVKGDVFPPTPGKGQLWRLVDATQHAAAESEEETPPADEPPPAA